MYHIPKFGLLLLTFFIIGNLHAQDSSRTYFFKDIGWTIKLPSDFTVIEEDENEQRKSRGLKALEESTGTNIDTTGDRTLISAKKSFNYFSANISFFPDETTDFITTQQQMKDALYITMAKKMAGTTIDSTSTQVSIDGVPFAKFTMHIVYNEQTSGDMVVFSRLHKKFFLVITYLAIDIAARLQIESMLLNSKFSK
jgi:hypothetical protein